MSSTVASESEVRKKSRMWEDNRGYLSLVSSRTSSSASRCFNDFPSVGPASQRSDVDVFFRSRETRPINVICWRGKVTVSDGVCLGIDIHPPPYLHHHHRDRRRTRSWQIGSAPSVAQINPGCQIAKEREGESDLRCCCCISFRFLII